MKPQKLWIILVLLLLIFLNNQGQLKQHTRLPSVLVKASVYRVIDGDTLDVVLDSSLVRVRLIGVDTPEIGETGYALAKQYVMALLPKGRIVYLESDFNDSDDYGRLLRYIWLTESPRNFAEDSVNGLLLEKALGTPLWMNGDVKYEVYP